MNQGHEDPPRSPGAASDPQPPAASRESRLPQRAPDWEAFYSDYRKPGYVPGFEITSKLGGGMFGLVYRARKQSIGKDYAIKFLKVDDGEVRRAVLQELEQVRYFAQIDHPNLVSIEDRGEVDGIPYLVMAFAGTDTLQTHLPSTPQNRDELVGWFLQACRGVAALHERSLVHFDLKPANVFLKGAVARVGDYGLSKLVTHSRGSLSMGRGTPYYMAPEMLQRRGDARSDIYSLGVMLYEILCGQVPFRGDSEWEVLRQHERSPVPYPKELPARERAVLERCLQKDPAARFQGVGDLFAALGVDPANLDGAPAAASSAAAAIAAVPGAAVPPPLPAELAAAAAGTGNASCVEPPPLPPPLPPSTTKTASRRARRASTSPSVRLLFVFAAILGLAMFVFSSRLARSVDRSVDRGPGRNVVVREQSMATEPAVSADPRWSASPRAPAPPRAPSPPRSPEDALAQQVQDFVGSIGVSLQNASKRRARDVPLRELDRDVVRWPAEFGEYRRMVQQFAARGEFSSGHAMRLQTYGFGVFVAAIEHLQELDYSDSAACCEASCLHQLLAQMTKIDGMVLDGPVSDLDAVTTRRFKVVADGWRQFAERFTPDDAGYKALLQATGRLPTQR